MAEANEPRQGKVRLIVPQRGGRDHPSLAALIDGVPGLVARSVDTSKLAAGIADLQTEIGELLDPLVTRETPGYRLKEVQVQVTVSASGSIGIASAGIQGSMTLVYEVTGSRPPPP
jgi:hypothetical protein